MPTRKPEAQEAERLLEERYAVSFEDIGLTDNEWLDRYGHLTAKEAVEEYADKYDLMAVRPVTRNRSQ